MSDLSLTVIFAMSQLGRTRALLSAWSASTRHDLQVIRN